ncbi:MAG: AAA family ATPase [Pseudomonadota bacterium]
MLTVVANLKGGTGKSTVVFNLALWLRHQRRRVLAVDLDPQRTLTDVLEVREEEGYTPTLEGENSLDRARAREGEFEELVCDVGPSDLETLYQAVVAADRVLIPVPPSQADVWSTHRFVKEIRERRGSNDRPEILAFINRGDTHQAVPESDETFAVLGGIEGLGVLAPRLKQRMAFRRSFSEGLSAGELEPRGKAAAELDALAAKLYGRRKRR